MNHSSHTSVAITAIVVALGMVASTAVNAFLMTTTPAYAAPAKDKVIERGQGIGASATWTDINVEVPEVGTVVEASIYVIKTEAGADLSIGLFTEEGIVASSFTTLDPSVFEANKKLTSATLSPVTIEVVIFDEFGEPIGTTEITVQATWEGIGDILVQKDKSSFEFGEFSEKTKGTSESRQAIAEGSVDNADLGTSDDGAIFAFKVVTMTVSPSIIT